MLRRAEPSELVSCSCSEFVRLVTLLPLGRSELSVKSPRVSLSKAPEGDRRQGNGGLLTMGKREESETLLSEKLQ